MVSANQAKDIVRNAVRALPPGEAPLSEAVNLVLAEAVHAVADLPAFDQSNVDGFAIRFAERALALPVRGEMPAGAAEMKILPPQTAIRIFTGAPIPDGADTVVMQEKTEMKEGRLLIHDPALTPGANVRPKGNDIARGMPALQAGTRLTPAAAGYLASLGVAEVSVYPVPSVYIIITGKELVAPGSVLRFGQVYDSASLMLRTALQQYGINRITVAYCDDELQALADILETALQQCDMVLLTGGVSVGAYDFVHRAAELNGVTKLFHTVKQKPGKPLYFGMKDHKPVFGLPGNPSSVLTCLYEYVSIALDIYLNWTAGQYIRATLLHGYSKPAGLTHFLKGACSNGEVEILPAQESYRMSSFARSNCLVILPEEETVFNAGDQIEVHLI